MVVITLHRRKSQSDFKSNDIINKATKELTKTAMLVTIIFIISLGFDLWYYVLAYHGVVPYILYSPIQVSLNFPDWQNLVWTKGHHEFVNLCNRLFHRFANHQSKRFLVACVKENINDHCLASVLTIETDVLSRFEIRNSITKFSFSELNNDNCLHTNVGTWFWSPILK